MRFSDAQPVQRPSWVATLDWAATFSGLLLLTAGILMMLNGHCSQPHGLSADAPMCVGSQLSVQSWLAITGIEFSLLSTVLLPRVASMTISKSFTRAVETSGMRFDHLLNSLSTAPLSAQLQGSRKVLLLRCLIFMLAAFVSVLYKFSFVRVDAPGRAAIPKGQIYYNYGSDGNALTDDSYTAIGESDIPREYNYALGHGIASNVLSANLLDFLTVSNGSVIVAGGAGKTFEDATDLIVGPKVNVTRLTELANGTVESCGPLLYLRSSFFVVRSFDVVGTPQFAEWPLVESTPYNGGVRIEFTPWNSTISNGGILDITSLTNGSLQAWAAADASLQRPGIYDYMITVTMRYCYGYIRWTNSAVSSLFQIKNPTDIQCQALPFDVAAWNQTSWSFNAKAFIQATCAGEAAIGDSFWTIALPIIAIVQDHASVQEGFAPLKERNSRCSGFSQNTFAVTEGVIRGSQTGMTALGMALQALVIIAAAVTACLIVWPRLPLLTEWPAHWLALTVGLRETVVREAVKGSAAGTGVKSKEVVYLSLATEGSYELRLSGVGPP